MSTFPLNYDKRHWTIHSDLFILIIKTVVKTPFFLPAIHPTAPYFVPSTLSHLLRRFGLRGFLRRLSKGPEVDGWFMGYFCDQLWVQKWWIWFGKGTWLLQLCCESGGGICHEVMGFSGIVFVEIRILFVVLCNNKVWGNMRFYYVLLAVIVIML